MSSRNDSNPDHEDRGTNDGDVTLAKNILQIATERADCRKSKSIRDWQPRKSS